MESLETYLLKVTLKDVEQVIEALRHLSAFNDIRAVSAIQNAFFHSQPQVRTAAAHAAGENLDAALLDALLSLLDDLNTDVRLAAVTALGKYARKTHKEKIILALLERQPEPQTKDTVRNIILNAGPGVIPILESELNSLDEKRRERAIDILPALGDLGVMTLVNHLPHLNIWESLKSAKKLGALDHPMLEDYFLEMLRDPDMDKRRFAMAAVGSGKTTLKAIHAVGEVLLNDTDQHMRLDAAVYLKWANHPIALTYFDQFDASREKGLSGRWIREAIRDTRIMIDLQMKSLEEILALLFTGEKHERPLACVEISRRENPIAIPFLTNALLNEKSFNTQGHILVCLRDLEAVEAVNEILAFFQCERSNDEDALALRVLGELYHPKALDYLKQRASEPILNDIPSEIEPIESARKAVKMCEERMAFMKHAWFTLADENDENRIWVALQLAMRGDDRGIDMLMDNFSKTDIPAIRYQTLRALGESGSFFVLPFLRKILPAPDERLVWHTLIAIGQLPVQKAPVELSAMLLDDSAVIRMAALFALGHLKDDEAIPAILNHLEDPDQTVRAVALQTLAKFTFNRDWLRLLEPHVADSSAWVRLETARILHRENLVPSRDALKYMLKDENHQIRLFATEIAALFLAEDLRPALKYCASIKGGRARRNARQLIERLDWQEWAKDPDLLEQKKQEAMRSKQEKARKKMQGELPSEARETLKRLIDDGWESMLVTQVAGSAYVNWEELYADLKPGQCLTLSREGDNPYDALAIMVLDEKTNKLGYIPRHCNTTLANRMDAGDETVAMLLKVEDDTQIHHLHIEVFIFPSKESE